MLLISCSKYFFQIKNATNPVSKFVYLPNLQQQATVNLHANFYRRYKGVVDEKFKDETYETIADFICS